MFGRLTKLALFAGVLGYAVELGTLEPTLKDLFDPQWHREAPMRLMMKRLAILLPALYEKYGERGVKALEYVFYRIGEDRGKTMQEALRIDPRDARSLGRSTRSSPATRAARAPRTASG